MRAALYNEIDPFAAQWLRNLGDAGHITKGTVDERSIRDLAPADVVGFQRAHFFAGIGVWDYALRRAGWSGPVWTGSCPCQPFSAAGKRKGLKDDRHLWPEWFRLIRECRPATVIGEQVASAGDWLDVVSRDLEAEGYAFGAVVLGAHSVGAPHIRQRFYFVAHAMRERGREERIGYLRPGESEAIWGGKDLRGLAHAGGDERRAGRDGGAHAGRPEQSSGLREARGLADADGGLSGDGGLQRGGRYLQRPQDAAAGLVGNAPRDEQRQPRLAGQGGEQQEQAGGPSVSRLVGNADHTGPQGRGEHRNGADERTAGQAGLASFWADAEWIPCADGKLRPAKPGIFPLVNGTTARVGKLRAAGNALCAETAITFIRAVMEAA